MCIWGEEGIAEDCWCSGRRGGSLHSGVLEFGGLWAVCFKQGGSVTIVGWNVGVVGCQHDRHFWIRVIWTEVFVSWVWVIKVILASCNHDEWESGLVSGRYGV